MQKVIVFGGTFDPPHNGHMALLQGAIRAVGPDKVLVIPAGTPPHKAASTTPAATRLAMCACFLSLAPQVELDDTEIVRGGKSYTVDTLRALAVRYPDAQFYLPIGSDMLLTFEQWHAWREILQRAVLVVQCRRNEDMQQMQAHCDALRAQGARIVMADGPMVELSSTQIRKLVHEGNSAAHLVPPEVQAILTQEKLYQ
jgi:nicotinate-nucleotide adenylyltransferase